MGLRLREEVVGGRLLDMKREEREMSKVVVLSVHKNPFKILDSYLGISTRRINSS
jgi:hypothetical protein